MGHLWKATVRAPQGCFFHCRHKTTNLIDIEIHVTAETMFYFRQTLCDSGKYCNFGAFCDSGKERKSTEGKTLWKVACEQAHLYQEPAKRGKVWVKRGKVTLPRPILLASCWSRLPVQTSEPARRLFGRCFEALCIELNSENCGCIEFVNDPFRCSSFYSLNQRVHCSLGLPNEPRRSATEPVCSSGLTLSLQEVS